MVGIYTFLKYNFILPAFALLICPALFAQQKKLSYSITNKKDTIGKMQITQLTSGEDVFFTVNSLVETRVLINIKVNIQEESHYRKDKLLASSSKRLVNDKIRGSKTTEAEGNYYLLKDDNEENKLNQKSIGYNFSKLYFIEPTGVKVIYSDYYQKNIIIQPLINHSYKIDLPDSGFNIYYYKDGVCTKIDVHGALFSAQMTLN